MARKKKTDEDENNNENLGNKNDSDDTFGLPEIEYKPLNRDEEEPPSSSSETQPEEVSLPEAPRYEYEQKPVEPTPEYAYDPDEEITPVWPKVLGILIVIVLALGASYWWWWKPRQAKEKARIEAEAEQARKDKETADRQAALDRAREEAEKLRADSLANASKVGVIETLSGRTGRYYVVIASAVDDDLLMDYAKKLRDKAVSTKIIPPFGKYKLFRLAVADGDTFASTQEVANAKKAEYGDALWVLKY